MYKPQTHTLELILQNYLYIDTRPESMTGVPLPLEVWLGSMGPLPARVYQNASLLCTTGPIAPNGMSPGGPSDPNVPHGSVAPGQPQHHDPTQPPGPGNGYFIPPPLGFNMPPSPMMQTMVVVEMPPVQQVLQLIEQITGASLSGYGAEMAMAAAGMAMNGGVVTAAPVPPAANGSGNSKLVVMAEPSSSTSTETNGKGKGKGKDKEHKNGSTEPTLTAMPTQLAMQNPPPTQLIMHPHGVSTITRGVPILFVRPLDGIGYHSGREIACENVFAGVNPAPVAPTPPGVGSYHGWTLRVL